MVNYMEIKNAKITSVDLYIEDHGMLTFSIDINYEYGGCSIGGYALDQSFKTERLSTPAGLDCMRKIMEIVGVKHWSDLVGQYIRFDDSGWGSHITKIGNIITDDWMDVQDFFKNYDYKNWVEKFATSKLTTEGIN